MEPGVSARIDFHRLTNAVAARCFRKTAGFEHLSRSRAEVDLQSSLPKTVGTFRETIGTVPFMKGLDRPIIDLRRSALFGERSQAL